MRPAKPARIEDGSWRALVAAALLHAAVLGLARVAPAPALGPGPTREVRADAFDVEVEAAERAEATTGAAEPRAEVARAAAVARAPAIDPEPRRAPSVPATREPAPTPRDEGAPREPPAEPGGPAAGEAPPPGDRSAASAPPSSGDAGAPLAGADEPGGPPPGLDGRPVWMIPGVIAPLPAPTAAPTSAPAAAEAPRDVAGQVLRGTLQTRDRDLGLELPAGGVVASAVADAVRGSGAPMDARATFEVRLAPDGRVLGARVVKASAGEGASWDRVAARASKAIAARGLRMSGDAAERGATVTVSVESKVVYPAGTKEKLDAEPVCAEELIEDAVTTLAAPLAGDPGRAAAEEPAQGRVDVAALAKERAGRRFCIPIGVRGKFDLSNVGAHAQQVVTSTFKVAIEGQRALPADTRPYDDRAPWLAPSESKRARPPRPPPDWKKKKKKKP